MKISSFQPMNVYEAKARQESLPPAAQTPASEGGSGSEPPEDIISQEEKQYFTKLYPNDTQTITSYSTYSKKGVTKEYSVGSLVDKKS